MPLPTGAAIVLAVLLGVPGGQPAAVEFSTLGPQVGERVPDFRLQDQAGTERTLPSLMGKNGVVLVFFRSADW